MEIDLSTLSNCLQDDGSVPTSDSRSDLILKSPSENTEKYGFRKVVRRVAHTLSITRTLRNNIQGNRELSGSRDNSSSSVLVYSNSAEKNPQNRREDTDHRNAINNVSTHSQDNEENSNKKDKQPEQQSNPALGEFLLCRVYKKVSGNNAIALYLPTRDFIISEKGILSIEGVYSVNEAEVKDKKVFMQLTLTFRYGRDDEEVMGLRLSNESLLCLEQIHPLEGTRKAIITTSYSSTQSLLLQKLGSSAKPFRISILKKLPPSVRLLPAKEYKGAAIGINYDVRLYTADKPEDIPSRRQTVKMGIRVIQEIPKNLESLALPQATIDKNMQLLSDGKVSLEAKLDKSQYRPSEKLVVSLQITNNSGKSIKKVKVSIIQHVDVSMFSNGKFKNVVAHIETPDNPFSATKQALQFQLELAHDSIKQWVALEERYGITEPQLAATTFKTDASEKNYFAIYVDYYMKNLTKNK